MALPRRRHLRKLLHQVVCNTENIYIPLQSNAKTAWDDRFNNTESSYVGYNTFDDSYFNHEHVFLNDEVEFLDIFDDLEEEIKEVTNKTAEYYVSMLKTCNLVEGVKNNPNYVEMENLYMFLFDSMDVTILARILSSVKDPALWETKLIVADSLTYLGSVAEKFVFTNSILNVLGSSSIEDIPKNNNE
mgnify:CR=1 FL=1